MMNTPRTYPEGVSCWIDLEVADVEAAARFYAVLFGWTYIDATASGSQLRYLIAQLDGEDVAGIGQSSDIDDFPTHPATWNTYIAVKDVDEASARVAAAGGRVTEPPSDVAEAGRTASCVDTEDIPFRLWQPRSRLGAQLTNIPGAWNFSDLHTAGPGASVAFYTRVFGWQFEDLGFATMIRQPGYGDHLAATSDPDIYERQSGDQVPPGFADAIGWLVLLPDGEQPHWHVTFTVGDRDESAATAERLDAFVLSSNDTMWTRDARIRDPQHAVFTVSQYAPPSGAATAYPAS
jgi:predicted enzyme related to lactoylglutathione lyase